MFHHAQWNRRASKKGRVQPQLPALLRQLHARSACRASAGCSSLGLSLGPSATHPLQHSDPLRLSQGGQAASRLCTAPLSPPPTPPAVAGEAAEACDAGARRDEGRGPEQGWGMAAARAQLAARRSPSATRSAWLGLGSAAISPSSTNICHSGQAPDAGLRHHAIKLQPTPGGAAAARIPAAAADPVAGGAAAQLPVAQR